MAMFGSGSIDKTKRLIYAVFERPALWDRRHSQYENIRLRDEMIQDIALLLGTTGSRVEWEWNLLLNQLKQEFLKLQNHYQFSPNSPFISNWPYFKMMSFLKEQMLSDINKSVNERMIHFDHQSRNEGYLSQCQFTGDKDFRRQHQIMYDGDFEAKNQFTNVRAAMQRPYDEPNFMPPQYMMDRQDFPQPTISQDIPQHHFMNKGRFMPRNPSKNSLSTAQNKKRRRKGGRKQNDPKTGRNSNTSSQSSNEIKKVKVETHVENIKSNNVAIQGKSLAQNSSNLQHNGEKITEAVTDKSSAKKDESNVGNEVISPDLDFFRNLLPYMQNFPRITKLKVLNKIQKLVLDEHKNLNKNEEEAPSEPVEQCADSLMPVLKSENGDPLQNKE